MTLDLVSVSLVVARCYVAGFCVLWPPLAWVALGFGWWAHSNFGRLPRLAGAVSTAMVGALLSASWHYHAVLSPQLDLWSMWKLVCGDLIQLLITAVTLHTADSCAIAVIYYAPLVLSVLLYILARRYDEALSGMWSRFRERLAERRASRELTHISADLPETPRRAPGRDVQVMAPAQTVIEAPAGEAVVLPGRMMIDSEDRQVVIVINVKVPMPAAAAPVMVRYGGRGYVSGACISLYYLAATASRLWLPLLALWLWFYGPGLVVSLGRALKPW